MIPACWVLAFGEGSSLKVRGKPKLPSPFGSLLLVPLSFRFTAETPWATGDKTAAHAAFTMEGTMEVPLSQKPEI